MITTQGNRYSGKEIGSGSSQTRYGMRAKDRPKIDLGSQPFQAVLCCWSDRTWGLTYSTVSFLDRSNNTKRFVWEQAWQSDKFDWWQKSDVLSVKNAQSRSYEISVMAWKASQGFVLKHECQELRADLHALRLSNSGNCNITSVAGTDCFNQHDWAVLAFQNTTVRTFVYSRWALARGDQVYPQHTLRNAALESFLSTWSFTAGVRLTWCWIFRVSQHAMSKSVTPVGNCSTWPFTTMKWYR